MWRLKAKESKLRQGRAESKFLMECWISTPNIRALRQLKGGITEARDWNLGFSCLHNNKEWPVVGTFLRDKMCHVESR